MKEKQHAMKDIKEYTNRIKESVLILSSAKTKDYKGLELLSYLPKKEDFENFQKSLKKSCKEFNIPLFEQLWIDMLYSTCANSYIFKSYNKKFKKTEEDTINAISRSITELEQLIKNNQLLFISNINSQEVEVIIKKLKNILNALIVLKKTSEHFHIRNNQEIKYYHQLTLARIVDIFIKFSPDEPVTNIYSTVSHLHYVLYVDILQKTKTTYSSNAIATYYSKHKKNLKEHSEYVKDKIHNKKPFLLGS